MEAVTNSLSFVSFPLYFMFFSLANSDRFSSAFSACLESACSRLKRLKKAYAIFYHKLKIIGGL